MSKSKNKNVIWTKEEENYLIKHYQCESWEKMLLNLPRHNKSEITSKASYIGIKRERLWSFDDIEELKRIYSSFNCIDDAVKSFNYKYTKKQIEKKAHSLKLNMRKRSVLFSSVNEYIRDHNYDWKSDSLKACNYKCVFTNSKNIEIHHKHPFSKMVTETLDIMGYDKNSYEVISQNDLNIILTKFNEIQAKYGLGVCVDINLHKLFHSTYSFWVFDEDDWNEFSFDIVNGKYNEYLLERNLALSSSHIING